MFQRRFSISRGLAVAASAVMLTLAPSVVRAQDVMTKESVTALKTAYVADLAAMHEKFLGLANAFPQDKYTWRPMEGVRSVSEVLMLAAFEGYAFVPTTVGGKRADLGTPDEANKLRTLSDKAQVIDHLNKGFAYAKKELDAIDPATLTGKRKVMNQDRSAAEVVLFVSGDLHEHLGQLIAYARMNRIVPPWSK